MFVFTILIFYFIMLTLFLKLFLPTKVFYWFKMLPSIIFYTAMIFW